MATHRWKKLTEKYPDIVPFLTEKYGQKLQNFIMTNDTSCQDSLYVFFREDYYNQAIADTANERKHQSRDARCDDIRTEFFEKALFPGLAIIGFAVNFAFGHSVREAVGMVTSMKNDVFFPNRTLAEKRMLGDMEAWQQARDANRRAQDAKIIDFKPRPV